MFVIKQQASFGRRAVKGRAGSKLHVPPPLSTCVVRDTDAAILLGMIARSCNHSAQPMQPSPACWSAALPLSEEAIAAAQIDLSMGRDHATSIGPRQVDGHDDPGEPQRPATQDCAPTKAIVDGCSRRACGDVRIFTCKGALLEVA